jgi:4-coumarate--CoA ligase
MVVATEQEALYMAGNIKTNIVLGIILENFMAPAPEGWVSMTEIAAGAASQAPESIDAPTPSPGDEHDNSNRTALVVYTSGSSGVPKGCPLSVSQMLSALGILSKKFVPLLPAPITLVSGVSSQSRCQALITGSWVSGNAAVIDAGKSTAKSMLAALETCRPVSLSLLVTAVASIARAPNYSADAIKSVRFFHLTGATATMAILRTAQKMFPRAKILAGYAMTEATAITM